MDFGKARESMVQGQVRVADIDDRAVIDAFRHIPREAFAPRSAQARVYSDLDIAIDEDRWLLRPRDLAKMIDALEPGPGRVALDLGCGRGYSTALLGLLCESVVAVEDTPERVERATRVLLSQGIENAAVMQAPLSAGAAGQGPFDMILFAGAVEVIPDTWRQQLNEGGRLVTVLREGPIGKAVLVTRSGDAFGSRVLFDSGAPLHPQFARARGFQFA